MAESRSSRPAPALKSPISLDLSDPETIRAWLARVETGVDDAIGAAEDQLRPLADRNLGRLQARRIVGEAKGSLARLLASMRAVLPEHA